MKFTKMHGSGHDYVIVDSFADRAPRNPHGLALEVSDRQRGIGAQGLIVVEPADDTADARMQIYSGLGEEMPTCLHGLRCVAKYLFDRKLADQNQVRIESMGTLHTVQVTATSNVAQSIRLDLGPPQLEAKSIPTTLAGESPAGSAPSTGTALNALLDLGGSQIRVSCVGFTAPHCVLLVEQLNDELVTQLGPFIEFHDAFPKQTNVEFACLESRTQIQQRSWGRGSGEMPASVEGAAAALVAAILAEKAEQKVTTWLPGGSLELEWDAADPSAHVFATGTAVEVFSGQWNGLS